MISLRQIQFPFEFPLKRTPAWAPLVERWPQLDAASVGLAQAYVEFQDNLGARPAWILLASPGASNDTDALFVASGACSPSKFVHTLPNIRSAALFKIMDWSGPLLCLQNDPKTLQSALVEAAELFQTGEGPVWIAQVTKDKEWVARFFIFEEASEDSFCMRRSASAGTSTASDNELLGWLSGTAEKGSFSLADGWEIVKSASSKGAY